ncbi:muscarinic acetylcholine receptor M2-like [Conger conger]|uniref:muscarinic acetylcholine receptor M2-like n=1 Tax=Conger conger TaxID=82655 RepID=UPI002A5AFFEC|nr:muscarinic acetylcholine receptor M2-like [Conger conger]
MELNTDIVALSTFSNISNASEDNGTSALLPGPPYLPVEAAFIVLVAGSLSLVTIIGNILVMLSIIVNRSLQTINNYFLVSLACADLIIGMSSMNLYTVYIVIGYWPLGPVVCDLWLALDYVVSNASVMNLLIISFDRYFCVTKPLSYPMRDAAGADGVEERHDVVGRPSHHEGHQDGHDGACHLLLQRRRRRLPPGRRLPCHLVAFVVTWTPYNVMVLLNTICSSCIPDAAWTMGYWLCNSTVNPACYALCNATFKKTFKRLLLRQYKDIRSGPTILVAFVVTWTPYNVMVLLNTVCSSCIPNAAWTMGYWLCYINSTVNPACYALCNATFKKTFKRLLLCQYKDIRSGR